MRAAGLLALALVAGTASAAPDAPALAAEARAILERLVAFDTQNPPGNEVAPATWLRERLAREGVAAEVLGPDGQRGNLVARVRGSGARRPLLLLAHLDTVNFVRSEWKTDPLRLTERDGALYGRGVGDA